MQVVYWCVPLVLSVVLLWLDLISLHSIRYEELAESVRNVFWLDERLIYDGVYSNVGWYGTLLVAYKLFGFSLFSAKFVRLGIHVAGLYAAAVLLRRALPMRTAMVPLVAIGLSPTLLYFETLQTSFGLDVPYAAMCLALLCAVSPGDRRPRALMVSGAMGAVAMLAAMSYPSFLLYVPSLVVLCIWQHGRSAVSDTGLASSVPWRHGLAGVVGAAVPLVAAFVFVQTPELLLNDPATQAGLFRGGGQLGFDPATILRSVKQVLADLFLRGGSYYFDVTRPDLSGPLGILAAVGMVATLVYLIAARRLARPLVVALGLLLVLPVLVPSLAVDGEPGIRRSTGLLVGVFASYVLVWQFYTTATFRRQWVRSVGVAMCLCLPIGHLTKISSLADDLGRANIYENRDWFTIAQTPDQSLTQLLNMLDAGKPLACPIGPDGLYVPCRYQEVFPALAGYRRWNGLETPTSTVNAVDWKTGRPITLSPTLWRDGYYPTCTRPETCRREIEAFLASRAQGTSGSDHDRRR